MKLKDIANITIGLALNRKKSKEKTNYKYKQFTLKCFDTDFIYPKDEFEIFYSNEPINQKYLTQQNDIVIRLRYPIKALYIDKSHQDILIPSFMAIIRPIQNIDSKFLTYYLNSMIIKRGLKSKIEGTQIPMIGIKDLNELEINLPNLKKQNQVTQILEINDKEIKLLEELKQQKKLLKEAIIKEIK